MINQQTPGPLFVDDGFIRIEEQAQIIVSDIDTEREWTAAGPGDEDNVDRPAQVSFLAHPTNAKLLAAAYNAFDKAAREMGVDAVELAEKFPIEDAIEVWASAHVPNMPHKEFLHGWFGISKHIKTKS